MNYKEKLDKINTFILDVDGVLTDGSIQLMPDGSFARSMNVRDGYAMQYAIKQGFTIAIITGGRDEMVQQRLRYLGITDIYLGSFHKIEDYKDILFKYNLKAENIVFVGDDIPDLEVMEQVGLSVCPYDACSEIRAISDYISPILGGKGVVRDIIEQVLKVQGKWNNAIDIASV